MSQNSPSAPLRVLVAEDDPKTRQSLVFLLQRHGYDVTLAIDGQQALETLLATNAPPLALLDWEMPRLDGLHVARAVRSIPERRYTYLIMVTARDSAKDMLAAFAAGVDDFLSKPVDAPQLLARLRSGERLLALEERLAARISELGAAQGEVRKLQRLLPICMYCKKVRDDRDYWHEIETYLIAQGGTDVSHGICPQCMKTVIGREPAAPDGVPRGNGGE